jgi:hypothetical protein
MFFGGHGLNSILIDKNIFSSDLKNLSVELNGKMTDLPSIN